MNSFWAGLLCICLHLCICQKCRQENNKLRCINIGLTQIPDKVSRVNNFIAVWLTHNKLSYIGENAFSNSTRLLDLYLSVNKIAHVASTAFDGTNIRSIYLSQNLLKCVPNLASVRHSLRHVQLTSNQIGDCTDNASIANDVPFIKLQNVFLEDNKMSKLPTIVANSGNLFIIELKRNRFCKIPNLTVISRRLTYMIIEGNPLCCDCDVLWILEFVKRTNCKGNRVSLQKTKCVGTRIALSKVNYTDLATTCMETTTEIPGY